MKIPLAALALAAGSLAWPASGRAEEPPSSSLTEFQKHAALFSLKCAKCHTIGRGDRVGPDLRGVAERRDHQWILNFIMKPEAYLDTDPAAVALRQKYHGVRMENTHLTRPEAEGLLDYLQAASAGPVGPAEPEPVPEEPLSRKLRLPDEETSVSVPGLAAVFLLLAAAAAAWQLGSPLAGGAVLILAAGTGYWSLGGRRHYHLLGNQQGYQPVQPIAFSHAKHAGQLGISCFYCHFAAEKSDVAGVPPVGVCMNCHGAVRQSAGSKDPSPEIAKLVAAWEARRTPGARSIEWLRVHQLPDYVHFSHRVHVNDNIQCQECHGPVETMSRMRQAAPLSMGWCVQCHREREGTAPTHWKRAGGPLDCAACHW